MTRFPASCAAVVLILTVLAEPAAGRQQTGTSVGSGAIGGRVELVDNNQRAPLRRATVTLRSESGNLTRTSATDAAGAYRFDGIPAGNYRVSVEKAGFLTTPGMDSRNPFPESSVTVAAGSQLIVNVVAERAAALEGRLIEDTGRPIAGLAVTADRLADASDQPTVARSYSAKTDDLGRFRLHTLPPGRYRVSAIPPSPASGARLYYPGTEKIEEAGILDVARGQTVDNLAFAAATVSLPAIAAEAMATQELESLNAPTRGGSWAQITGRVTRADVGQPIPNAAVKLSSGSGALLRTAWTDGAGEYSFTRVIAGVYQVSVSADGYAKTPGGGSRITVADGERLKRELVLTPLSAIEGRVLDEFGDPVPGVVLRLATRTNPASAAATALPPAVVETGLPPSAFVIGPTDDRGSFRASGLLAADYYLIALPEPFARSGPAAFPITYFPGATSFAAGTPLQLLAGIDAHGVNLVLQAAKTAGISGTVVDATGRRVPKALVTLSPSHDGPFKGMFRAAANADADGNFVYPNVPEGTYLVEARTPNALAVGSLTITTPAEPFALALKPLPTARGRVTFDGGAPPEVKPQLREVLLYSLVRFQSIGPIDDVIHFGRSGVVETDWTFRIPGLSSVGVIRTEEFMGWSLFRVLVQGRDITDVPYDTQSGDLDGIEVVLTRRVGTITGTVFDGDKPADPVAVVVFGADGDSWPYLSRTFRAVQPQAGTFSVRGLLPGRYFVIAVRPGTPRSSEEALRALRAVATPVVVSEGADASVKLTIVK